MARAGRKPKPTALKILEGNPGRRPLNDSELTSDMPLVKPMAVAEDALASHEWDRVVAAMPRGLYSALDAATLTSYAQAWSIMVQSERELRQNGVVYKEMILDGDGNAVVATIKRNPAAVLWKAAADQILKTGDRLGLNPSVRSRLQMPTKQDVKSKFAGMIGRGADDPML